MTFKITLYCLAILISLICTALLFREYRDQRRRLLLWVALCFVGLSLNNILLFVDLVVFPTVDLRLVRVVASLSGMMFLLYGFIWDVDA